LLAVIDTTAALGIVNSMTKWRSMVVLPRSAAGFRYLSDPARTPVSIPRDGTLGMLTCVISGKRFRYCNYSHIFIHCDA
jgi:hypothetical protein